MLGTIRATSVPLWVQQGGLRAAGKRLTSRELSDVGVVGEMGVELGRKAMGSASALHRYRNWAKEVSICSPAGNEMAQRRALSERNCRRPGGASIRCVACSHHIHCVVPAR